MDQPTIIDEADYAETLAVLIDHTHGQLPRDHFPDIGKVEDVELEREAWIEQQAHENRLDY